MLLQEGDIASGGVAIGLQGSGRGSTFVVEIGQPGDDGRLGAGRTLAVYSTGHRSAVRSTTRARKATSSEPISTVKPPGSSEPKASTACRAGDQIAMRTIATLCTASA